MRVRFNSLAERELNDAAQYYEREEAGLGVAFIADVHRCTEAIAQNPNAGLVVLGTVRRRLVTGSLMRCFTPSPGTQAAAAER